MANQSTTSEAAVTWPRDEVIKEAKRIEEGALLNSKAHFAAANRWGWCHLLIGVAISVLAAIAAAFTFSSKWPEVVGAIALTVAVLSAVTTFLDPNRRAKDHLDAGNGYDAIGNRARIFWSIDCWSVNAQPSALMDTLRGLSQEKSNLNLRSPQIAPWAYRTAKQGVKAGEGVYAVDEQQTKS